MPLLNREPLRWEILVDGRPLPAEEQSKILSVVIEAKENHLSTAEVKFFDQDLVLIDKAFDYFLGRELIIRLGWLGQNFLNPVFLGLITSLKPNFPATEPPTLTIIGADKLILFGDEAEGVWPNSTISSVVKSVFDKYHHRGFRIDVVPTSTVYEAISKPEGISDIDFLFWLAHQEPGYTFYSRGGTVYFGPKVKNEPFVRQLTYGQSLERFSAEFHPPQLVEALIDLKTQQVPPPSVTSPKEVGLIVSPPRSREDLRAQLDAMRRNAGDLVVGVGQAHSDPGFAPAQMCFIDGIGSKWSGLWYVNMVRTSISAELGWVQTFEATRTLDD